MKSNEETRLKWLEIVFDNISKLETRVMRGIENESFTEDSLEKLRTELQQHYGALNNLRKSFSSDTYFTGYIE